MYLNTPSSGHSTRTVASEGPSTPLHAPRMGAHGLPLPPHAPALNPRTPYGGANAPYPIPHPSGGRGHTVAYGLMTPPDSPDKPQPKGSSGRGQLDLHPTLDARSPHLLPGFDVRRGMVLRSDVFLSPAVTQPVRMVRINLGPLAVDIINAGGAMPTVQDVVCGLMRLNSVPATPQEVAAAVQMGFVSPGLPPRGVSRGRLLDVKPFFGGFTLRAIQQGTAFVDCHLRAARIKV
ncbi:hypothetical protein GSI_14327 [Ganoderma sinense ZZ0214-1]|uniref:Uncharacterized protein n=1 Tax=Ganoderma sinense ZZ0214-1 TaxID=1077348 RepID=A0A2G8RNE8_9APHY|nr:hypothetical protein GSI_14327 [Ganoderma sinense ZZ0214-1]